MPEGADTIVLLLILCAILEATNERSFKQLMKDEEERRNGK